MKEAILMLRTEIESDRMIRESEIQKLKVENQALRDQMFQNGTQINVETPAYQMTKDTQQRSKSTNITTVNQSKVSEDFGHIKPNAPINNSFVTFEPKSKKNHTALISDDTDRQTSFTVTDKDSESQYENKIKYASLRMKKRPKNKIATNMDWTKFNPYIRKMKSKPKSRTKKNRP